jgi:hypothetical protein
MKNKIKTLNLKNIKTIDCRNFTPAQLELYFSVLERLRKNELRVSFKINKKGKTLILNDLVKFILPENPPKIPKWLKNSANIFYKTHEKYGRNYYVLVFEGREKEYEKEGFRKYVP